MLRATVGVALMMQGDFCAARTALKSVSENVENVYLPSWLPNQAVAAIVLANHAAAIIGENRVESHTHTVSLLDASLEKLPHYAALYRQLASCLILAKQFPKAMSSLHCALAISLPR